MQAALLTYPKKAHPEIPSGPLGKLAEFVGVLGLDNCALASLDGDTNHACSR